MRNPDDRCGREDCGVPRLRHAPHFPGLTNSHAFVEPAPQAESALDDGPRCQCGGEHYPDEHPVPVHPDPDAVVRALTADWKPYVPESGWNALDACAEEAFAAGRALGCDEGAREEREALAGIAQDRMSRCGHRAGTCRSCMEDGALIDIIVRRGKEGT